MASRNIAITEDLYDALTRRKIDDESFTKVIFRIMRENERPSDYFGAWGDISEKESEGVEKAKKALRDMWTKRN
jgi:predicted CopG family antitoxin